MESFKLIGIILFAAFVITVMMVASFEVPDFVKEVSPKKPFSSNLEDSEKQKESFGKNLELYKNTYSENLLRETQRIRMLAKAKSARKTSQESFQYRDGRPRKPSPR